MSGFGLVLLLCAGITIATTGIQAFIVLIMAALLGAATANGVGDVPLAGF